MPVSGRLDAAAPPDPLAAATAPLVSALQSLYRAYQKSSIYPQGHPAIPEALAEALAGLEALLGERHEIAVGVARGELSFEGEPVAEAGETLGALASLLYELEVVALEFHSGLAIEELERFIHELNRSRREGVKGTALVEAMEHHRIGGVRPRAIDYGALQFSEGARGPRDEATRKQDWENVARVLINPAASPSDSSPHDLAAKVTATIRQQEGTGVGLLKKRVQLLSRQSKKLAPDRQRAVQKRIADFVAALSPKLRRDLLCVDPRRPEESLEFMETVVEDLSESDLLRALRELDTMGARVPGQMLTLLNKLVTISSKHPTVAANLEERLKSWGVAPEALSGAKGDLQEALQEVFQRRERSDFYIPQPHKRLLDDLSRNQMESAEFEFHDRYRDPQDMYDVRLHAAQMAVRLVGGRGGERHRAGLFAYLATVSDSLIERGRFDVVNDAAVTARTYSLLKKEPEATRRAAQGFLNDLTTRRTVQRILEHACAEGRFSKDALGLLALGGADAVDGVVRFLDLRPPAAVAETLKQFVVTREPRLLDKVLETRTAEGWTALRPLLPLIGAMPAESAAPLLEKLLTHEDFRVRRQAYTALLSGDDRPADLTRYMRQALADENPRVAAVALQRLLELQGAEAEGLLGEVIDGGMARLQTSTKTVRRISRNLLLRGETGVKRLCACLDRLRGSVLPRRVRAARVAAETLRALRKDRLVRRCLVRWKLSPSGLAAVVLPRSKDGDGGER